MARFFVLIVFFFSLASHANAMWEMTPNKLPPVQAHTLALHAPTVSIPPQVVAPFSQPIVRASQRFDFHNGWRLEVYADLPAIRSECPGCRPFHVTHGWSYDMQVPQIQTWAPNSNIVGNLLLLSIFFLSISFAAQTARFGCVIADDVRIWRRNRRIRRWYIRQGRRPPVL